MIKIKFLIACIVIVLSSCESTAVHQDQKSTNSDSDEIGKVEENVQAVNAYDAEKARSYGADDYGMKTYVLAFLKRGPNRPKDSVQSAELMKAHLDNIGRLAEEGKLVLAGPFYGDQDLRGIYIFDTDNLDSARAMTETDPAIQHGSLEMELFKWYGSAGLMEVNNIHTQISKEEI